MIIDYKSGQVVDSVSGLLKGQYARQLLLYAYLESESSGSWPDRLAVLPIRGEMIDVVPDTEASLALATEARGVLAAYNAQVPQPQPGNPSESVCTWCDYVVDCPSFWTMNTEDWANGRWAIRGRVVAVTSSNSRVTVKLDTGEEVVTVRAIDATAHKDAAELAIGDDVAFTALIVDIESSTYRVGPRSGVRAIPYDRDN